MHDVGEANQFGGCASPDEAVRACIEHLRTRGDDIADALGGQSLRVALDLGDPPTSYRITFTREGHVMTRSGAEFNPHMEIHGPSSAVARFLAGDMTMTDATFEGILTLHVSTAEAAEYMRLRALVAEELVAAGAVQVAPGGT